MNKDTTIEKKITDMAKYGITGERRWDGSVVIKTKQSINVHGKYFPTREQAEQYADELYAEVINE